MKTRITCKTCNAGRLRKRKKYRMSGVVVLIGYILLVPSILGIAIGALGVVTTGAATGEVTAAMADDARNKLHAADLPPALAERVATGSRVTERELDLLSDEQRQVVDQVELELTAGTVGAAAGVFLAGGASLFIIGASFVGGLLGWLLVMKKKVLQCVQCGAVVAAS